MNLPLPSARLVLRHFNADDVPPFCAYRNDPDVARYQSWEACNLAEATTFVVSQKVSPGLIPGEWFQIAVALKETDQLIGDCALCLHPNDPRQATLGFTFAKAYQGCGLATEALSSLLDHLFHHLNLHRGTADTDSLNTRAWGLLERLGFRREAHLMQKKGSEMIIDASLIAYLYH